MAVQPTKLSLANENLLVIEWADGTRRQYDVAELRQSCPCATCNAERAKAAAGNESPIRQPTVTIQKMQPVGNYAYNIHFSDGHDTGIYTLQLLQELGREM